MPKKTHGLGRGLDSLFAGTEFRAEAKRTLDFDQGVKDLKTKP